MKKLILTTTLFCFVALFSYPQESNPKFTVPEDYAFVNPEDYANYEPQVIEAIDWYLWRSMAFDAGKRKEASSFFLQWLIGSPSVTVEIQPDVANFFQTNPELMMPFMMGWTKHSLENNSDDNIKGSIAGIEAVVRYYQKNRGFLKENKEVEKYAKMIEKNKLEKHIKKVLKNNK